MKIGKYAFHGNYKLKTIKFPENVTELDYACIGSCPDLESVYFLNPENFLQQILT